MYIVVINYFYHTKFQFVPILFVISTSSMLIMDQRTMQIKYRIPASEIIRLSLSPYFDDIAVFHVKAVSYISNSYIFNWNHDNQYLKVNVYHSLYLC